MLYYYKDKNGQEFGPFEQPVIENAIAEGGITAETELRTDLLKNYKKAKDFVCFARHFAAGGEQERKSGFRERFLVENQSTALKQSHIPKDASLLNRVRAMVMDAFVLFAGGALIFGVLFFLPLFFQRSVEQGKPAPVARPTENAPHATADSPLAAEPEPAPQAEAAPAGSGGAAQSALRNAIPKIAAIEQRNAERNREILAAADGKKSPAPAPKKDKKKPKLRQNFSGSWEEVPDETEKPKNTQVDAMGDLSEKVKDAVTKVEVPKLTLATIKTEGEHVFSVSSDGLTVTAYPAGAYRVCRTAAWAFFALFVLLYYSLSFGYYAQSVGMWYYGIFVTRSSIREAGYLRCYCYAVSSLLLGVLMIPSVFFSGRSLADWLCGIRVINVYGATRS